MKTDFKIQFRCPYCNVQLEAKEDVAAKTLKCVNCLKIIKVPTESQIPPGVRQEMLLSAKSLFGYTICAKDGNVGSAYDFLFDDEAWTVRYLVVDTGEWLPGRKVLLRPLALGHPDYVGKMFPVELTRELIEKSPPLESDMPVSRQHEHKIHVHYGWPVYWGPEVPVVPPLPESEDSTPEGNSHLRSIKEVSGYHIEAADGAIGHVDDFIVGDEAWQLRYLVIDTKNWLPGRKVIIAPDWVKEISWPERRVKVDLSREEISEGPEFNFNEPVNRQYEKKLYDYYGRPQYWTQD